MEQQTLHKIVRSRDILNYAIKHNIADKEVLDQLYGSLANIREAIYELEKGEVAE